MLREHHLDDDDDDDGDDDDDVWIVGHGQQETQEAW